MAEKRGSQGGPLPVVGIDLGTTYSCIAAIVAGGEIIIIENEMGKKITPSYVAFTADGHLVGDSAKNQAGANPSNTIFNTKRLIGRSLDDESVKRDAKYMPFQLVDEDGKLMIQVTEDGQQKKFTPEHIAGLILQKLKDMAEQHLGIDVTGAVITVPAYFNNRQREATKLAGQIIGLEVLQIINEPTAAAMAHSLNVNQPKTINVLVFDLGKSSIRARVINI